MSLFVRVEYKIDRKFIEIENVDNVALVVNKFQIQNARGKSVYIYDQHQTRVHEKEELNFLLRTQLSNVILTVKFEEQSGRRSINHCFTSKVNHSSSHFLIFVQRLILSIGNWKLFQKARVIHTCGKLQKKQLLIGHESTCNLQYNL